MRRQVGLNYAADVARLSRAAWQGSEPADWKRPGSFLERQVPQWRSAVAEYRQQDGYAHDSLPGIDELCDWLESNPPGRVRSRDRARGHLALMRMGSDVAAGGSPFTD
jgi:hypothetical protein